MSLEDPRPPPPDPVLLTFTEAMRIMRVSRKTLYNWQAKGLIAVVYTVSGNPRIIAASLATRSTKVKRDE